MFFPFPFCFFARLQAILMPNAPLFAKKWEAREASGSFAGLRPSKRVRDFNDLCRKGR